MKPKGTEWKVLRLELGIPFFGAVETKRWMRFSGFVAYCSRTPLTVAYS